MSRQSRSFGRGVECLDYVRMLKSRGIGTLFEEQNTDTLKSDSELYLVIYAGFAQAESESNGFGQDLNPVVPIFKGRKCADFAHLLPFFRVFIC